MDRAKTLLRALVEVVEAAIKAGDWKVDGACDPSAILERAHDMFVKEHSVSEYEDGWFVERPDPNAPLEECKFIQVAGPFKREATARKWAERLNQ